MISYIKKLILSLKNLFISESCTEIKVKFLLSHFFVVPQKVLWRPMVKF